jgi:hypothetical protein
MLSSASGEKGENEFGTVNKKKLLKKQEREEV